MLATRETPPRAWGRLGSTLTGSGLARNTPTGVGKTPDSWGIADLLEKHPHGRGEDFGKFSCSTLHKETPPRAWGRLSVANRKL